MRCNKVKRFFSEYLLGDISPRHKVLLEKHIDSCFACAESLSEYRELFCLISDSSIDEPSDLYFDSLPRKVLSRIKSADIDSHKIPFSLFRFRWKLVSALATVILIVVVLFRTLPNETSTPSGTLYDFTEIEQTESYTGFISSIEYADDPLMFEHFDISINGTSDNSMWYSDTDTVDTMLLFTDEEQEEIFNEIKEGMS